MTSKTTCGDGVNAKEIGFNYLIVHVVSPYNITLGPTTINALGMVISTIYLVLKYPFPKGKIGII